MKNSQKAKEPHPEESSVDRPASKPISGKPASSPSPPPEKKPGAARPAEKISLALITTSPDGYIKKTNCYVSTLLGFTQDELIGLRIFDLISDNSSGKEQTGKIMKQFRNGEFIYGERLKIRGADGKPVRVGLSALPIRSDLGKVTEIRLAIADFPSEQQIKEALENEESLYRTFLRHFHGIAFQGNLNFVPLFLHGAVEDITGYSETDFTSGKPRWDQIIHPDDLPRVFFSPEVQKLISLPGYTTEREYRIYRKDGALRWVKEFNQNICDNSRQPILIQGVIYDITEQKITEESLRESEEKLRVMLEEAGEGILLADLKGTIINLNDAALSIYQAKNKEEIIGRRVAEFLPDSSHAQAEADFNKLLKGGHIGIIQYPLVRGDASRTEVEANVALIRDDSGTPTQFVAIIRDITERKRAEKTLRAVERRSRLIEENITDIIAVFDTNIRMTYVTPSVTEFSGFTPEEVIAMTVEQGMTPESFQNLTGSFRAQMDRCIEENYSNFFTSKAIEVEYYHKNGNTVWGETKISVLKDTNGHFSGFVGITRDITERKRAEEALRESREKTSIIFEAVGEGITVTDMEGTIIDVNEAAVRNSGYRHKDEMLGKNILDFLAPEDRVKAMDRAKKTLKYGRSGPTEYRLVKKGGNEFDTESNTTILKDKDGNPVGFIIIARDISRRKRTEDTLKRIVSEWRTTFDTMSDAVLLVNRKHQIIRANKAAAKILGLPFHDIIGQPCYRCVHLTNEPPGYCPHIRTMADGEEHSVEIYDERLARHFLITTTPLVNLTGSVHVMHDITERKEAESALKSASLETLETMSRLVEASDPYTAGHSKRVTELAVQIAKEMGIPDDQIEVLRTAGFLHDLGKVGIPDTVLNKPTRLTQAEQVMIQHHPVLSAETSERVAAFKEAVPVIRHHHENWDGTGYPNGLRGEEIPLLARILSVADSYDAMTSERPYRRARTTQEALAEMDRCSGSQWDPTVVEAFVRLFQSKISE